MSDELTSLRVSVARVAQAAGVSLKPIGVADDAEYTAIRHAALTHPRGWNTLAGDVVGVLQQVFNCPLCGQRIDDGKPCGCGAR